MSISRRTTRRRSSSTRPGARRRGEDGVGGLSWWSGGSGRASWWITTTGKDLRPLFFLALVSVAARSPTNTTAITCYDGRPRTNASFADARSHRQGLKSLPHTTDNTPDSPQPSSSSVLKESDHLKSPGIIPGAVSVEPVHCDSSHGTRIQQTKWRSGCSLTPGGYATSDHLGSRLARRRGRPLAAALLRVASARVPRSLMSWNWHTATAEEGSSLRTRESRPGSSL
mmetsp:Transcript_11576/g.26383  ORF Transcript_11576/g.26383 Transcript_11576/m.26383 type:complete len:227 (-) Transcript_11576:4280-4960(-)